MKRKPATQSGESPGGSGLSARRSRTWRLMGWVGVSVVCAGLAGGAVWLWQRANRPERLVYRPAGGQAEAEALVARMLTTNRPWLGPRPVRATYSFRREVTTWSLSAVGREHSLRHLRTHEKELTKPLTARWKSETDLRVGVLLETPLAAMLGSNYTIQSLGQTRWRGRTVVAVDVSFLSPIGGGVGMGAGTAHYSSAGFRASAARILIDPVKAVPLFIGTSEATAFGAEPRFSSSFVFDPDFFETQGGFAPRFVEWRMPNMSWRSRYEFQMTNDFWVFNRGRASIWMDRWSHLDQQLELTGLHVEALRPGDLTQEYPTGLTAGDASPDQARAWNFGREDTFRVSRFSLEVGRELRLELGPADLGVGHCADGAVWAVLIPRDGGSLTSSATGATEMPAHVWLRFHPNQIARLFPPQTLSADGKEDLRPLMCAIANVKMMSHWAADGLATIPEPGQMLVDADIKNGPRRLFEVDTRAGLTRYAPEWEQSPVNLSPQAIELMSEPLPDHRQAIAEQSRDSSRPRVVSVQPAPGTTGVAPATELRVRFDRAMDPLALSLHWDSGDFLANDFPRYDSNTFEFTIPIRLAPGVLHQIVVNSNEPGFGESGFLSADSKLARLYVWRFVTRRTPEGEEAKPNAASSMLNGSRRENVAGSDDPRLLGLLQSMKQRRAGMTSFVERVQELSQYHQQGLRNLHSQGATFRWQQPSQYYGDVSQIMGVVFRVGCDGRAWWWQIGSGDGTELVSCPTNGMQLLNISFADPFGLTKDSPATAVKSLGLVYAGLTNCEGMDYHLVEARSGGPSPAPPVLWWIDAQTYLVTELDQEGSRTRFLYDSVNKPVAAAAFTPAKPGGLKAKPAEALDAGYNQRFVNLCDGSDGRMSVRWGKVGPKGRSSSGLN